jgi:hypothetical protein
MTAKEKAKELFNNYFYYVEAITSNQQIENAKKCALIAVDEILRIYKENWNIENYYWRDVKKEIENYETI